MAQNIDFALRSSSHVVMDWESYLSTVRMKRRRRLRMVAVGFAVSVVGLVVRALWAPVPRGLSPLGKLLYRNATRIPIEDRMIFERIPGSGSWKYRTCSMTSHVPTASLQLLDPGSGSLPSGVGHNPALDVVQLPMIRRLIQRLNNSGMLNDDCELRFFGVEKKLVVVWDKIEFGMHPVDASVDFVQPVFGHESENHSL